MNRRETLRWVGVAAAMLGGAGARAASSPAGNVPPAGSDHGAIIAPLQQCTAAVTACIAHCQRELAAGNRSMGECLRAALDCDVTCTALLRAAGLQSAFAPALARVAIDAMTTCVAACEPHVGHHAACKECHDACVAAITAARAIA